MTKKSRTYKAWAIDLNSDEGHGMVGIYWWFGGQPSYHIPAHLQGCKIALFATRGQAIKNLHYIRASHYKKAKVVRVRVTIEPIH